LIPLEVSLEDHFHAYVGIDPVGVLIATCLAFKIDIEDIKQLLQELDQSAASVSPRNLKSAKLQRRKTQLQETLTKYFKSSDIQFNQAIRRLVACVGGRTICFTKSSSRENKQQVISSLIDMILGLNSGDQKEEFESLNKVLSDELSSFALVKKLSLRVEKSHDIEPPSGPIRMKSEMSSDSLYREHILWVENFSSLLKLPNTGSRRASSQKTMEIDLTDTIKWLRAEFLEKNEIKVTALPKLLVLQMEESSTNSEVPRKLSDFMGLDQDSDDYTFQRMTKKTARQGSNDSLSHLSVDEDPLEN
jgi:hypothetical protein